jgi:hypothetical protein
VPGEVVPDDHGALGAVAGFARSGDLLASWKATSMDQRAAYQQDLPLLVALGHDTHTADTLDTIGHPHGDLGEYQQARTVWQQAMELYRQHGRTRTSNAFRPSSAPSIRGRHALSSRKTSVVRRWDTVFVRSDGDGSGSPQCYPCSILDPS